MDSNDVCDVVPDDGAHRSGSRLKGDRLFSLEAGGPRAVRVRYTVGAKGRQRPLPIRDDHVEAAEGIGVGRCVAGVVTWDLRVVGIFIRW